MVAVECPQSNTVIVTFGSFSDGLEQEQKGFGEAFFEKNGITAYHFMHKHNLWYDFPEMTEALHLVKSEIAAGHSIITYGSSMGGYAAFRSSGLLQACKIIAFSPQYSVDSALVPWENRWSKATINCTHSMDRLPINHDAKIYLFYDPKTDDAKHAELISQYGTCQRIPMPFSGHFCISMLQQIDMLGKTLRHIIDGDFDATAVRNEIDDKAEKSAHYLVNKANSLPYRAKKQRLALMYRAIDLGESGPEFELYLGKMLVSYGLWSEAKAIYYRGWKKNPNSNLGLLSYLGFLNLCRRYAESLPVFERLAEQFPQFVNAVNLTREKFDCYPYGRSRWNRTLRSVRGFCSPISTR